MLNLICLKNVFTIFMEYVNKMNANRTINKTYNIPTLYTT